MRTGIDALVGVLLAICVLAVPVLSGPAMAQGGGQHIDKVANKRLSGTSYARIRGLSYEDCERRCLAEARCVAIEHYRGGGVIFGRNAQCKLFSVAGEVRSSNFADIGFKRAGPGRRPPPPPVTAERRQLDERTVPGAGPGATPRTGAQPPDPVAKAPLPPPKPAEPLRRAPARDSGPAPAPAPGPIAGGAPPPPPAAAPETAPETAPSPRPGTARKRSILKPQDNPEAGTAEWDVVPVFYGTDRNRRDAPKRIAYGSDRAKRVELGRALITIPKIHQVPKIERPWEIKVPYLDWKLYGEDEDPRKHFTIKDLRAMPRAEMLLHVRQRLAASSAFKGQAIVFVHGYNNAFDDALYRAAQVAYDLNFDGATFLYSWPSGSGIEKYLYDRASAAQSEPHLTEFLEMVLNESGAQQVSLIAHSMGNQLLLQVLRHLKARNPGIAGRINQVILAAPDVDRDEFEYLAGEIRGVARGVTMYASSNDLALQVARRFAGDKPRAGDVPSDIGPSIVDGLDTIDVSALSTDYLAINHSFYAERTPLLRDIELVLKYGIRPPDKRFPVFEAVQAAKGSYWRYPR